MSNIQICDLEKPSEQKPLIELELNKHQLVRGGAFWAILPLAYRLIRIAL